MRFSVRAGFIVGLVVLGACPIARAEDFTLSSQDLRQGIFPPSHYAAVFGCSGANVSPDLSWSGAPVGTKSFALTIYDPDAPTGSGWWHWVVVNLPPTLGSLPRGVGGTESAMPAGSRQIIGDIGQAGYLGPCPPQGQDHRYVVTVTALKVDHLDLPENATAALAGFMINANSLGKTTLTARAAR